MPISWLSWKRSLACKSEHGEVHDPQKPGDINVYGIFDTIKSSGCSRSVANLKDVIHSSRRVAENSSTGSPLSVQSCDFFSSINHDTVLRSRDVNQESEINNSILKSRGRLGATSAAYHSHIKETPFKRYGCCSDCKCPRNTASCSLVCRNAGLQNPIPTFSLGPICQICGETFARYEALENHHLVWHSVLQLGDEHSSRKVIEIIFRTSWNRCGKSEAIIERILKIQNLQNTIATFEDYREKVKVMASKLKKKHPRCLADGNELLRFYGTTVACSLGTNGSSNLCGLEHCSFCRIMRMGISEANTESGEKGIITTSTSGKADELINMREEKSGEATKRTKRAMLVCRVIAGRIRKFHSDENYIDAPPSLPTGFHSMAGNMQASVFSNIEELYVFNSEAVLPCFALIYSCYVL